MNENSALCAFIARTDDWADELAQLDIKIKREGDLAIFNYGHACNYSHPLVQESRGIIIDVKRLEVVCWPFRKFGNYNEYYADEIDWASARVLEKVDGSIIKLWFDASTNAWQFSTNGMIRAENAPVSGVDGVYYADIIKSAQNYADIPFDKLDKNSTYIFELVSPTTRVLVSYDKTYLYHTGTRHNVSGCEREEDIGIEKPRNYAINSLAECIDVSLSLNKAARDRDEIVAEGFVVVDKNYNRVKVKSPDYMMMSRLFDLQDITKRECVEIMLNTPEKIPAICSVNPHLYPAFKYYEYKLAEMRYDADVIADCARKLYEEYSHDRGAVAKIVKKHYLYDVAFKSLSCADKGSDILNSLTITQLAKLIPDYVPFDLKTLFD